MRARALATADAYLAVGDSGRGLLLAEALHGLRGHFGRLWLVRARSWEVRAVDVHERPTKSCEFGEQFRRFDVGASALCGQAQRTVSVR